MTDHDILVATRSLTESNAKAIEGLTNAIKELANTVREEDKELKHAVTELLNAQTECKFRWEHISVRIDNKQEILHEVRKKLATKADKDSVSKIWKIVWVVIAGVFSGLGGIVLYLIKLNIAGG